MDKIINIKDMYNEIMSYLDFGDKIRLHGVYDEYYNIGNKYLYEIIEHDYDEYYYEMNEYVEYAYKFIDYYEDKCMKSADFPLIECEYNGILVIIPEGDKMENYLDNIKNIVCDSLYNLYLRKLLEIQINYKIKFDKINMFDGKFEKT